MGDERVPKVGFSLVRFVLIKGSRMTRGTLSVLRS